jgi:tetratricopeptide (TPR) repeat protein
MLPRVSLCMIVKDEAADLARCLGSVAGLVAEAVLVDTGSADRTKEVAIQLGARVFDFPWCDNFAAARNESLTHATGDWILWLDADELLDLENRQKLARLLTSLASNPAVAYLMKQRSAPTDRFGVATVTDHLRLFPNLPGLRWQYRVHEQILPALSQIGLEVRQVDITIEHLGYRDPAVVRHKWARNRRLLQIDHAEHPDDPFLLFNLGLACLGTGELRDAESFLRRGLERSPPGGIIGHKLYGLLAECYQRLGQRQAALAACSEGLRHYPGEGDLLFREAMLHREQRDWVKAEACLGQLLESPTAAYIGWVSEGLRGFVARHNLAAMFLEQGRFAEAEAQWWQVLAERPGFLPARQGLGELYLVGQRWAELDSEATYLEEELDLAVEAASLRGRGHLARQEFAAARRLLEQTAERNPQAVRPRVLLAQALLQEGRDLPAAEAALRAVLELAPGEGEWWRNLAVLLRQQHRAVEAVAACRSGRAQCPDYPDLLLLQGAFLCELADLTEAETCLVDYLARTSAHSANGQVRQDRETAHRHLALIYDQHPRLADKDAFWRTAALGGKDDNWGLNW